jgi:hypothetical protein
VLAYNATHWDWAHLGLADLLAARGGLVARLRALLGGQSEREFYWYTMEIADRGRGLRVPSAFLAGGEPTPP